MASIKELIIAAKLTEQFKCCKCGRLLDAYGRADNKDKWSCYVCNVTGCIVTHLAPISS